MTRIASSGRPTRGSPRQRPGRGRDEDNDNAKKGHHRPSGMPLWRLILGRLMISARANNQQRAIALGIAGGICLFVLLGRSSGGSGPKAAPYTNNRVTSNKYDIRQPADLQPRRVSVGGISSRRLIDIGYPQKPRSLGYYFNNDGTLLGTQQLDPYLERRQKEKSIYVEEGSIKRQMGLKKSKDYLSRLPDKIEEGCTAQYDWQLMTYPSCNHVLEFDFTTQYVTGGDGMAHESFRIVNNGYWRDVSMLREWDGKQVAVKTMRYEHEFEARNYDRHRKDALASERLTSSPYVANIYGFCGNSGVFDYADEGDIDMLIWPEDDEDETKLTKLEKLDLALQVSRGIAAAHNSDKEGRASLAHTDISPGQFILIDGFYQLTDFNRARLIMWNEEKDEPCPFHIGNNPGKFRSPEEYQYLGETEKVDVYSMGNVFYTLLTGSWPFEDNKTKDAQKAIMRGQRPPIEEERNSKNPLDIALLKAIDMCWAQDPEERSTAREVEQFLEAEIAKNREKSEIQAPPDLEANKPQ